jgi:hypothetical protein
MHRICRNGTAGLSIIGEGEHGLFPDQTYRAFLLKMSDAETETAIEEAILDGAIDPAYLRQIEEELIDDSLLGRLSEEEIKHFRSDFLCTAERKQKLRFASAIRDYSAQQDLPVTRSAVWSGLKKTSTIPWTLSLAGALACALIAAAWLADRNLNLNRELAQTTRENNESQRLLSSLQEQQRRSEGQLAAPERQSVQTPPNHGSEQSGGSLTDRGPGSIASPVIRLSSGISRGLEAVPVLHLGKQANMVSIVLELPFDLRGGIREELLDSNDQSIWSQEFSAPTSDVRHGLSTIMLPAALFSTGEYRLRVRSGTEGEQSLDKVTYLFRVRGD